MVASLVAQLVKNPPAMQEIPVWFLGCEDPLRRIGYQLQYSRASLVAQIVKNPPAMWETWVWYLGREDPLEEHMATHSSFLAWRIPMDRGAWQAVVHGVTKSWTWLSHKAHTQWGLMVMSVGFGVKSTSWKSWLHRVLTTNKLLGLFVPQFLHL